MGGSTKDKEFSKWAWCGGELQANNIEIKETGLSTETETSSILKTSSNYNFNIKQHVIPSTIKFSNTTLVAFCDNHFTSHMHHTIPNHYPNRYTAQPVRSIIKNKAWHPVKPNRMTFDRVICEYERREYTIQSSCSPFFFFLLLLFWSDDEESLLLLLLSSPSILKTLGKSSKQIPWLSSAHSFSFLSLHAIFLINSIFFHFTGVLVLKNGSLVYDKYELTFVSKYCIRSYKSWIFVVEVKADGDSWFNFVWFLDNRNRYNNIPIRRRNRIVIATILVDFLFSRWLVRDIIILRFCDSCFALLCFTCLSLLSSLASLL